MSEFHYVRTTGVDGGVDAADGPAIGVDLETLLKDGLPPVKVALEIISSLCEILDIADEDGEIHGDVSPEFIFVDDTGAVSLEGFGTDRDSSQAPEREPVGTSTDLYGLGFTAFRLLSSEPIEPPMDDPDAHDDGVIDSVVGMNFGEIPEEFHGDIQWFIAKLMSWEPDDRPPAIEAWRTFIAFADETPGIVIEDWSPDAIEGGGERRDAAQTGRQELPEPEEDLSGPTKMKGPLAKGAIDFNGGGSKPGSATAFWSKDALKGALSEPTEDTAPDAGAPAGGGAGGFKPSAAQATSFWSKEQMDAMRQGGEAPRPKRGGGSNRPPRAQPPAGPPRGGPPPSPPGGPRQPAPGGAGRHFAPTVPPEVDEGAPPLQNQPPPPGAPGGAPFAQGPAAGPVAQGPGGPMGPPPGPAGIPSEEEGGNKNMMLAGIVGVVLLLLCLGIGGTLGGWYFLGKGSSSSSSSATATSDKTEEPEPEPKRTQDTSKPPSTPEPAPAPSPRPAPRPSPRPSPRPAPRPVSRPAPKPAPMTRPHPAPMTRPSPAPAPTSGKVRVTFDLGGRGTVGCSDGQQREVDGSKTVEFEAYQLPLSCMIKVDSGRWAGLISKSGTIKCSGSVSTFTCTGP